MTNIVGTMDTVGWLEEPTAKIDRLIAYWFANRADQCIFLRNIPSFNFVVGKHQNDKEIDSMLQDMQTSLRNFMLTAFESADIRVTAPDHQKEKKMYTLYVGGVVSENGISYDIAQSVVFNGETFKLVERGRHHAN